MGSVKPPVAQGLVGLSYTRGRYLSNIIINISPLTGGVACSFTGYTRHPFPSFFSLASLAFCPPVTHGPPKDFFFLGFVFCLLLSDTHTRASGFVSGIFCPGPSS